MTAEVKITALTAGTPKATDVEPAVDTTDPTQAPSGTTKKYTRADVNNYLLQLMGFTVLDECRLASTVALTVTYANGASGVGATLTNAGAQAAFSIDGVSGVLNDRILIKNQAAPAQNGIYTITTLGSGSVNWVLTRATDFDVSADMADNMVVQVTLGSTNNNTAWQTDLTAPVVVGTDAINFSTFSVAASLISLPVSLANGGTNKAITASNGAIVWCDANSFELSAVGSAGQVLQSNGAAAPTFSTPTYPSVSGTAGQFIQSNGTNNVYSAYKLPTSVGATLHPLFSNGTDYVSSTPAYPNASVTAGKIIISDGTDYIASTSIFPNTVGTAGQIIRSDGTVNAYTTSTFADTYAVNTLLYAGTANIVTGLATAASAILTTVASVPTWSTTLPAFTTSAITFSPTTGGIVGTTTNDSADAGKVGEFVSSTIAAASAVSLTTNTAANVTSISLTAGDWDVYGNVGLAASSLGTTLWLGWISSTSATAPDQSLYNSFSFETAAGAGMQVPFRRFSLAGTTTVYLSTFATIAGTATVCGGIYARRVR